jgi:phage tail-like protein
MADYDLNTTSEALIAGFQFALELDGVTVGYFKSIDGLGTDTETIEHKVVNEKGQEATVKVPGRTTWSDVTLNKALRADDRELWDWRQQVVDGDWKGARRNGSIVLFDPAGGEVARWNFFNAWPSSWKGAGMDATASDLVTEEITVVHEGLEKVT